MCVEREGEGENQMTAYVVSSYNTYTHTHPIHLLCVRRVCVRERERGVGCFLAPFDKEFKILMTLVMCISGGSAGSGRVLGHTHALLYEVYILQF